VAVKGEDLSGPALAASRRRSISKVISITSNARYNRLRKDNRSLVGGIPTPPKNDGVRQLG
jgi:hypothetical protein